MQTEISQQRNSVERRERKRRREKEVKESESTVASGSWSTDSVQRISILYLAKSATNHLGRLSDIPNVRALPLFSPLYFLCYSLFLPLSFFALRTVLEQALLFLCFSLPFSPYFSSARVTFSLNTERAGRSKDAGATAVNDMRPVAAGQLGNSRT